MKKINILSIILFSCILSIFSHADEERGIQSIADFLDRSVTIGRQYVLLIGINSYVEWPNLQNPVNDTYKLKDILTKHYFVLSPTT